MSVVEEAPQLPVLPAPAEIPSPQVLRMPRHVRALLRHSTPRRLANLLLVEAERLLGLTRLRGKPYVIFVDPINLCNLRCPLCATGVNEIARVRKRMDYEHFQRVIDMVAPHAYEVSLYNWGEPLLHKDIFEMVRYAKAKNLATVMSSNLSIPHPELMERLVTSGLDELTVSIDGVTQETYSRYRVRGNLDLVLSNLRLLLERRRALGSRTPFVEWQFIVFKHNEHEMEAARRMGREIGVDLVRFIPAGLPFDAPRKRKRELGVEWFSSNPEHRYQDPTQKSFKNAPFLQKGGCYYLYRSLTVNPDLGVAPCCVVYDEKYDFGRIDGESSLDGMWNNDLFRSARAQYSRVAVSPGRPTVCDGCQIFDKPGWHLRGRKARAARREPPPAETS